MLIHEPGKALARIRRVHDDAIISAPTMDRLRLKKWLESLDQALKEFTQLFDDLATVSSPKGHSQPLDGDQLSTLVQARLVKLLSVPGDGYTTVQSWKELTGGKELKWVRKRSW